MPRKVDKTTDKVKSCKISMNIQNGRRWISLKNHLGLQTDDELVDYLLQLADSVIDQESKSSYENDEFCREEPIQENNVQSNFIQNLEPRIFRHGNNLQRCSTRKFNTHDSSKSEKSKNVSSSSHSIGKLLGITRTEQHVNKSKCHRDEHKKKQPRIKDPNILATTRKKMRHNLQSMNQFSKDSKENDPQPEMNQSLELSSTIKTSKNFIENTNVSSHKELNNSKESIKGSNQVDDRHKETTNITTRFKNTEDIKVNTSSNKVCNAQGACAEMKPQYIIEDSISLINWINQHKKNSRVAKAIDCDDPMSNGYNLIFQDNPDNDDAKCEDEQENILWPLYSRESLPCCLELKMSNTDHGLGVFSKYDLTMNTQFGPLVGQFVQERDIPDDYSMKHIWEVSANNKYLSTTNPFKSNWMRYIRPSETEDSKNVDVLKKDGQLFIITCKTLVAGTELIFWLDSWSNSWTRKNKMDKSNCGGCNLKFSHPMYYRLHCCIFHDMNYSLTIRKYHCKVCGAAILGKDNIMKHAAQFHAGRGAYQCQYCKKFFLRLNYLEMHRTYGCSKNPQRSRPLCDFCGRKFCQPQKLKVHIKRMHSDTSEILEEFQCKLCSKLLGSRAALQRHMKEVHHKDVVGAAACDRCGKTFQNKSNLKIHMLTHSGVKPFKCKESECKAAFTTKQCLQFHYKKVHGMSDEKMPKIERSIAYTFDAYSGGGQTSECNGSFEEDEDDDDDDEHDDDEGDDDDTDKDAVEPKSFGKKNEKSARDEQSSAESVETNLTGVCDQECTADEIEDSVHEKWADKKLDADESTLILSAASTFDINDMDSSVQASSNEAPPLAAVHHEMSTIPCKRHESFNASLLVEAALDAAERDIGVVSIASLQDNDEQQAANADLYSVTSELGLKSTDYQVAHEQPASVDSSYVTADEQQQQQFVVSPAAIPNSRQALLPAINAHYRSPAVGIEPLYLEQEILTTSRFDQVNSFHSNANYHSQSQSHRGSSTTLDHPPNSDESDSAVQNLSLSIKDKSIQQMEASKFDYEPDYNSVGKARVKFEPLVAAAAVQGDPREQGLDMSARGFQQTCAAEPQMQTSNHLHHYHDHHHHHHHHHHQLHHNPYKMGAGENEGHGVDLSTSASACVSPSYATIYPSYPHLDVSRMINLEPTSKCHELHTAVSRIIAGSSNSSSSSSPLPETLLTALPSAADSAQVRVLPSSISPISTYNAPSYSIGTTAAYHTNRSGYHYRNYY